MDLFISSSSKFCVLARKDAHDFWNLLLKTENFVYECTFKSINSDGMGFISDEKYAD